MKCFMTNQDCISERKIQRSLEAKAQTAQRSLFVVSPYGYPYNDMYEEIIKPIAKAASIEPQRADKEFQLGFVMCQKICKLMQEADYILADVTKENPNVYYEIGLACGFGKKIVFLRDDDEEPTQAFRQLIQGINHAQSAEKILSYKEIYGLPVANTQVAAVTFRELLETKANNIEQLLEMGSMRQQEAYILHKNISFCFRQGQPDRKLYLRAIEKATAQVNDASIVDNPWQINEIPIDDNFLARELSRLSSSKVFIVDVTHYDGKVNGAIYFVLGLSHALGKETIPITNRARNAAPEPFDVQGLWQIHFSELQILEKELSGILETIDKDYRKERDDHPLTFIWDKILKPPAPLTILTCARAAEPPDSDRPGGRTNVDKWDYASVGELAKFLASNYRQVDITINPPEEKETRGLDSDDVKERLAARTVTEIQSICNSVIIIGSPDVSDYAEIVLANAYGAQPYRPEVCKRNHGRNQDDPAPDQYKCWTCSVDNSECIGQRGYLFYKATQTTNHAREVSCFFRKPPHEVNECVVWYGEQYECTHGRAGQFAAGVTYGVLTFIHRPTLRGLCCPGKPDDSPASNWLILLSGFTGIATYGLTLLLTSLKIRGKTKIGDSTELPFLRDMMNERRIDLHADDEQVGVQVLLSVDYESDRDPQLHDSRKLRGCHIVDVKPLLRKGQA